MEEIRSYALNHRGIANANQEYYIVETPGPCTSLKNTIFDYIDIAPRPNAAQLVGTFTFSQSHEYPDQDSFFQARDKHCIAEGSAKYDWDATGDRQFFGWQVSKVKALTTPIPAGSAIGRAMQYHQPSNNTEHSAEEMGTGGARRRRRAHD